MTAAATSHTHSSTRTRLCWSAYLLGGLGLTALSIATPRPWMGVLWVLVQAGGMGAVVLGIRRNRPALRAAWWLVAAALAASLAADTLLIFHRAAYGPLVATAYPAGAIALLLLGARAGQSRRDGALDACIVVIGVAMPAWSFVIEPATIRVRHVSGALGTAVLFVVLDLVIVWLTARLAFAGGTRYPAFLLMIVGNLGLLCGDAAHLYGQAHGGGPAGPLSAFTWLAWSTFMCAAVLHPSAREVAGARPGADDAGTRTSRLRLYTFLALVLTGPLVGAAGHVLNEHRGAPLGWAGNLVVPALTAILAALLVLRFNAVATLANRRAAALDAQAVRLGRALREQDALQSQLSHRATHDPLTGLANRAMLAERLRQADGDPERALLIMDLDGFKDVNDTFGHQVGDDLLVEVAQRLTGTIGDGDFLARLGGDEFAILLPSVAADRAVETSQRALHALRAPFRSGTRELYLTISVGVLPAIGARPASEALRDADLALHAAKSAGKNQFARFEPRMRSARLDHSRLTTGLRRAVAQDEFTLHYQPVVDLCTGATYAVEALLRWTPPGEPMVPPDEFIPTAEDSGLIIPIGAWVLDRACAQARGWYASHGVVVTVNVSGHQLRDPEFVQIVQDTLERHRLPAQALVLEITETVLVTATVEDVDMVIGQLNRLREQGVRVAIDDFGTGYSSLSYLRNLPVDVLKIDRSFTSSADAEQPRPHEWAFTKAILEMSASLRLQTVAEGVETSEQARLLRRMNCNFAQGYHFSRPVPAAEIDALLAATPRRAPVVRSAPRRLVPIGAGVA
jgi:diguanylate cyclase (GGDEF)-like protein